MASKLRGIHVADDSSSLKAGIRGVVVERIRAAESLAVRFHAKCSFPRLMQGLGAPSL